ncbi:expressed unknown protein [Seminavis robusta]|uniref:Uncharacterized protein n=1 Tax=Seminavis robusta TaxID=568900 RepID=A0A9N8HMI4_9STRA|nr:expressed unknown protein [Seminavis robusta]|eukprot:Sro748_g196650.1 n/a (282) ;mRNA; f:15864-16709
MVVVGNVSACLVNAETKEPFKEHRGPDGNVYAEVEPDMEYFIEIAVVGIPNKAFDFGFVVDGKRLSYQQPCELKHGRQHCGIVSVENGTRVNQALCFRQPKRDTQNLDPYSQALVGEIQVDVFDAISVGLQAPSDIQASTIDVAAVDAGIGEDKILRSGQGSIEQVTHHPAMALTYASGQFLQTITIHYCTAMGLIHAGVLPKPDIWTFARMGMKKRPISHDILKIQPKRIKSGGLFVGDSLLEEPKEFDFFDLTHLQDEDDKDNSASDADFHHPVTPPHS